MSKILKQERLGQVNKNTSGDLMTIIGYKDASHIDVQFENGLIAYNKHYSAFVKGQIKNPKKKLDRDNRLNEISINSKGQKMQIVEYFNSQYIIVQFENGVKVQTSYSNFKKGLISNQEERFTKEDNDLILQLYMTNRDLLLKKLKHHSKTAIKSQYYRLNPDVKTLITYGALKDEHQDLYNELVIKDESLTSGASRKVEWISPCGHKWSASPVKRVNGMNCPYCSHKKLLKGFNDLETLNPKLAKEWNYDKNSKQPSDYFPNNNNKVWWQCDKGHEWQERIINRNRKHYGCPLCSKDKNESIGEKLIKEYLQKSQIPFFREKSIKIDNHTLFADFITEKGIIEFDGEQHFVSKSWFGGRKGLIDTHKRDFMKNEYCRKNNIPLLRIRYNQISEYKEMINDFINNNGNYTNKLNTYLSDEDYYNIGELPNLMKGTV